MNPGTYTATVIRHEFRESQRGTPSLWVLFRAATEAGEEEIGTNIWLTKGAMTMARKSLKAMGFDVDKESVQILDENPVHLCGKQVRIECEEEEYKGQVSIKVKWINPLSAGKPRWGQLDKALRSAKKANVTEDGTSDDGIAPAGEEEDIPF